MFLVCGNLFVLSELPLLDNIWLLQLFPKLTRRKFSLLADLEWNNNQWQSIKSKKKKMKKIMKEITNDMYRVHRGTYKAGKWSWNFSETTYLLPGGEWHMHMWGELPKCCHHKGKNGPASRWSYQVIQSSSAILCRLAWVLYFFTVHHYNRSTSKLIGF